jgi:Asp-tRNA(Asn)/Glu-tRNA(Gln) amidotransferase C subunit
MIDEDTVKRLEALADLPLDSDRRALLAPQLRSLIEAANELNRKMAEPRYQELGPQTRFVSAPVEEES